MNKEKEVKELFKTKYTYEEKQDMNGRLANMENMLKSLLEKK